MTTVFDIAAKLHPLDYAVGRTSTPAYVTDGLKPKRAPREPGLHEFTVDELLALQIPYLSTNGRIVGYQRVLDPSHARKIARALLAGKRFPPIEVALDEKGNLSLVDGQHTAVGGVIAGVPVRGVIDRLDLGEQRQLFADQRLSKPVDRNILTLTGDTPYEAYIQDAVTCSTHPWSAIVSSRRTAKTKITAYTTLQLLLGYVSRSLVNAAAIRPSHVEQWDTAVADELAPLIACFGDAKSNPLAFEGKNLRAIGSAASIVFRQRDPLPEDFERWVRHMPKFQFKDFAWERKSTAMVDHLLAHWNKKLPTGSTRRVGRSA